MVVSAVRGESQGPKCICRTYWPWPASHRAPTACEPRVFILSQPQALSYLARVLVYRLVWPCGLDGPQTYTVASFSPGCVPQMSVVHCLALTAEWTSDSTRNLVPSPVSGLISFCSCLESLGGPLTWFITCLRLSVDPTASICFTLLWPDPVGPCPARDNPACSGVTPYSWSTCPEGKAGPCCSMTEETEKPCTLKTFRHLPSSAICPHKKWDWKDFTPR